MQGLRKYLTLRERSESGREEAVAPKARKAGVRPSFPSEERGNERAEEASEHK